MTPAARLQAAVELLDEIVEAARNAGPAADTIVSRYFKTRRYAGSKDRRAVRDLVYRAVRRAGECPSSGRAARLGLGEGAPARRAPPARRGGDARPRGGRAGAGPLVRRLRTRRGATRGRRSGRTALAGADLAAGALRSA